MHEVKQEWRGEVIGGELCRILHCNAQSHPVFGHTPFHAPCMSRLTMRCLIVVPARRRLAFIFHLWHSRIMKALKSQLASELLADPTSRDQLRQFMTNRRGNSPTAGQATTGEFKIRREDGQSVRVSIVPKARAA